MCGCKHHHDYEALCTCLCDHPDDSTFTKAHKRAQRRIIPLRHDARVKYEKALMFVVWKMPRDLVYWSVIRVAVQARDDNPAEQQVGEMLTAWRTSSRSIQEERRARFSSRIQHWSRRGRSLMRASGASLS